MMRGLGIHYIAEYFGCDKMLINDTDFLEQTMTKAAQRFGAKIIRSFFHEFTPHGVSGVIIISESHFAIHCWPEHGFAAVDLFSCSGADVRESLNFIAKEIESSHHTISAIDRGILDKGTSPSAPTLRPIDATEG